MRWSHTPKIALGNRPARFSFADGRFERSGGSLTSGWARVLADLFRWPRMRMKNGALNLVRAQAAALALVKKAPFLVAPAATLAEGGGRGGSPKRRIRQIRTLRLQAAKSARISGPHAPPIPANAESADNRQESGRAKVARCPC
ncbi:MAG TPA: hypothetical protein DDZ68_11745 [Parvularcula sp.]|nr:hypothetical protein [Parvularcula sp.]HBS31047.1 hypothetical protein [Parvularcula sp.]